MSQKKYMLPWEIRNTYGLTAELTKKYLQKADSYCTVNGRRTPLYLTERVRTVVSSAELQEGLQRIPQSSPSAQPRKKRRRRKKNPNPTPQSHLKQFDISGAVEAARQMQRRFVVHCGSTNSGKTYDSIEALRRADKGIYLGPLRLLAFEVFDKLNNSDKPCSLLTGEEFIDIPFSGITAATMEMADSYQHYDVAVIDEAQLISDSDRGGHWLRAILTIWADTVHICTAPEALPLLTKLLQSFDAHYEVIQHERLTPLIFSGEFPANHYEMAQPGDAFIVFSRKAVLAVAAELERCGIRASVIYGALPPRSRRDEVYKLVSGQTKVVVATDAIGMGVSLPIKRIIFCQTEKYDGVSYRRLNPGEIKQIGGRAGRFGIYDVGEVLTVEHADYFAEALATPSPTIENIVLPFPPEAADGQFPLNGLLTVWQKLPVQEGFTREDMSEAQILYKALYRRMGQLLWDCPQRDVLRYITCPVDVNSKELVQYWLRLAEAIIFDFPSFPPPPWHTKTLEDCELSYKALDVQQQMLRRIGESVDNTAKKEMLEKRIRELLAKDKSDLRRTCKVCGCTLSPLSRFDICDACWSDRSEV